MHKLPDLKYSFDSLEPYIDAKTVEIHYSKHHAGYVNNLNNALKDHPLADKEVEELLSDIEKVESDIKQTVINNAGGHANHTLYWSTMGPKGKNDPSGKLKVDLDAKFGSHSNFISEFSTKALNLFGSGWVFLIVTKNGELEIKRHSFQNSPIMYGNKPILGLDVWEHAYYLKYQNVRADYIKAWWNLVDWSEVEDLYSKI